MSAATNAQQHGGVPGGGDVTAFSSGLIALLQPVVMECDQRLQGVFDSQRLLAAQIDGLAAQLDKFNAVSRTPALTTHIDKLLRAKARMVVINTTLANIQHRLVRIQREHTAAPRPSSAPAAAAAGVAAASPSPVSPLSAAQPSPQASAPSAAETGPATPAPAPTATRPTLTAALAAAPAAGGGMMSSWLNKAKAALVEAPSSLSHLAGGGSSAAAPHAEATAPAPSGTLSVAWSL